MLFIGVLNIQEDFFFVLHNILAEMEEVTELHPVPDAHVPVMKFKLDGISIDLLYASISLLVVPDVSSQALFSKIFSCSCMNFLMQQGLYAQYFCLMLNAKSLLDQ